MRPGNEGGWEGSAPGLQGVSEAGILPSAKRRGKYSMASSAQRSTKNAQPWAQTSGWGSASAKNAVTTACAFGLKSQGCGFESKLLLADRGFREAVARLCRLPVAFFGNRLPCEGSEAWCNSLNQHFPHAGTQGRNSEQPQAPSWSSS